MDEGGRSRRLSAPNQAGNKCCEGAGVSAVPLGACVYMCARLTASWLEARPKISSNTIVTLMQSGTVATTGPAVYFSTSVSESSEDSYDKNR